MEAVRQRDESWEAIIETVRKELRPDFEQSYPPEVIETAARESVEEFQWGGVRIRTFVPLLARRRARERLRSTAPPARR